MRSNASATALPASNEAASIRDLGYNYNDCGTGEPQGYVWHLLPIMVRKPPLLLDFYFFLENPLSVVLGIDD